MSGDESLLRRMLTLLREGTQPRCEELAQRWRELSCALDPPRIPLISRNEYDVESDENPE
jgi:hypothetical protein